MLLNYYEGSNEGAIGREAEMRGSMVKCVEDHQRKGEVCEIPVRLPMNYGAMEAVEHMQVDIQCMQDGTIGLCHKTAEIYLSGISCSTSQYTK